VADDTCVVDRQRVEQSNDSFGVSTHTDIASGGSIAPSVAEEVDHDDAVSGGYKRDHLGPQVGRGWKAMKKNDGLAGSATSCGVVVESRAVDVDELTAHVDPQGEKQDGWGLQAWPRRSSSHGKMAGLRPHHKRIASAGAVLTPL